MIMNQDDPDYIAHPRLSGVFHFGGQHRHQLKVGETPSTPQQAAIAPKLERILDYPVDSYSCTIHKVPTSDHGV